MVNRLVVFAAAIILIVANFENVVAGGSCQSYGHSCLGGHGKRNGEPPFGLHLLLQQALRARNELPGNAVAEMNYPAVADRTAYDFMRGFTNGVKALEEKAK
ncbi:uncharacterized protein LOC129959475 [Argiope bruennichi]|uniref:Uncharacterized protein n=1 Tax=Argiope bruennichi TaxID=94029 RepID=A0A8T0F2C7_ARGBR|nr:uncharacterized protein LOC129959475 [Argiope bruennichi]KAF8785304.1 hypothetical protein HNY73_010864 [Argiope bruennichi]